MKKKPKRGQVHPVVSPRRPKIVKEPTFIMLMLAAMVMHERWDDVKEVGYSDKEIQEGINFVSTKMDANEERSNAELTRAAHDDELGRDASRRRGSAQG